MKLKLKLTASEMHTLDRYLHQAITIEMDELRQNPILYLACSCQKEIYDKVHRQYEDIRAFPSRTDKLYSVSLTRSQSLAFILSVPEEQPNETLPAVSQSQELTFELTLLNQIVARIHQTFLV